MLRLLTALLAALALLAAGCGDDEEEAEQPADGGAAQTQPAETQTRTATTGTPAQAGPCRDVEAPQPKQEGGERPPQDDLDPDGTYDVTFETNCGAFTIRLDQRTSPNTAASFASLVEKGFYDGTVFHRIVPGFVIQGGDPTGTGTGGPGYSTRDRPPRDARYVKGVVAMAKTQAEPAGTAGSQFYVVTGADAGLPPDYALLGRVTRGLRVVATIGRLGDPATEMPTQTVVVEKATLEGP